MFAREYVYPILLLSIQMLLCYCMSLKAALPIRGIVARATLEFIIAWLNIYKVKFSYLGQTVD
jgi:hypothetical protein